MKKHTWMIMAVALALTASVVAAKSWMHSPDKVTASETTVTGYSQITMSNGTANSGVLVTNRAAREGTPDSQKASPKAKRPWTVMVVRGDQVETVTYSDSEFTVPIEKVR